jgi:hypothetical protein
VPRPVVRRASSLVALCLLSSVLAISMPSAQAASGRCRVRNLDSGRVTRGAGPNLQASIEAANPFETLGISGRCNGTFLVNKGLTFQGIPTAAVPLPTLDAHHAGVVLTTGQGPVTIDGLRIVNGDRNDLGGGIEGHGPLRVIDSAIRNDRAVYGGGGIFSAGPLIVGGDTVISDNTARLGAGVYGRDTMLLRDASTVHDNVARRGGGVIAERALTMRDQASVSSNYASLLGGGILGVRRITMSNTSVVQGNTAGRNGGGVYNQDVLKMDDDATISGNTATMGGGIFNRGLAQLVSCSATIVLSPNSPDDPPTAVCPTT